MTSRTTKPDSAQPAAETEPQLFGNWFDPIESGVREFIKTMMEDDLEAVLSRPRYARVAQPLSQEPGQVNCRCTDQTEGATAMATGRARFWAPWVASRSQCRAPG